MKNWPQGIGRAGQGRDKGDCCGSLADVIRGIPKGFLCPKYPPSPNLVSCLWNFSICKSLCGSGGVAFHRRDLCKMQTLEKDEVFHPAEAAWVFPPCQPGPGQPVGTGALRPEKEGKPEGTLRGLGTGGVRGKRQKRGHAQNLNSAGGVGVGGLRARARRLPAGNRFLGRAHRERGGRGGRARREGGAARGCGFTEKCPSVVRVEGAGQHPGSRSPRPSSYPAGSDRFAHLSFPTSPSGLIPEKSESERDATAAAPPRPQALRTPRPLPGPASVPAPPRRPAPPSPQRPCIPGSLRAPRPHPPLGHPGWLGPSPPPHPSGSLRCLSRAPLRALLPPGLSSAFSPCPSPTSSPALLSWRPRRLP